MNVTLNKREREALVNMINTAIYNGGIIQLEKGIFTGNEMEKIKRKLLKQEAVS
jgi:hypothetical protein